MITMPALEILPDQCVCEIGCDDTILAASLRAGIAQTCVCGGNARCSTCRVLILEGIEHCSERTAKEQLLAERLAFAPEIRLACQTRVTGNVKLRRLVLDDEDVQLTNQIERGGSESVAAIAPAGEERSMVILFVDIRDFTGFAE